MRSIYTSASVFLGRIIRKIYKKIFARYFSPSCLILSGKYNSFEEASRCCEGYSSDLVSQKVSTAVIKVLEGEAIYERDGTVFNRMPDNLKIRALLYQILKPGDTVVDFGGGLGGTYINHRDIVPHELNYYVVEQPSFVKLGQKLSTDFNLPITYFERLRDVPIDASLIILSSVLQYIPNPDEIIREIVTSSPRYVLIDRTAFETSPIWRVQENNGVYKQSVCYPHKSLHYASMINSFHNYQLVDKWKNEFDPHSPIHLGLLFARKHDYLKK